MAENYLIHFNRNHNPKNGRFDFGDGDGDGRVNERTSLREKYDKAKSEHRERVLGNETYKVTKGNLKLRQDQIANQRHSEKTSIKSRNLSLKERKAQAAQEKADRKRQEELKREEQKRLLQEERAKRLIDRERQKSMMDLERAEAMERKAQTQAAKNEANRIKREERAQQRAYNAERRAERSEARSEARAERRAAREYQNYVKDQNKAYESYTKKSKSQAGKAFIAAVTGRPITAIVRTVSAISNSSKAKNIANSGH